MNIKSVWFAFLLIIALVFSLNTTTVTAASQQQNQKVTKSQPKKKAIANKQNKTKAIATKKTRSHARRSKRHSVKHAYRQKKTSPYYTNVPTVGALPPELQDFDQKFKQFLITWKMPGAAVAIIKNGRFVMSRGYGWANVHQKKPVEPNSLFRIASISKAVTATTIVKLIDEKKLRFDDKVFNILNDIRPMNGGAVNPALYQITIQDLLQMTSGWGKFDPMFGPWPPYFRNMVGQVPADCYTTARAMMNIPLRFKPGTHTSYSNFNYCLLGLVINKVNHQPYSPWGYQQFVKQHVLTPLQINDMRIGSTHPGKRAPGEVSYYNFPGFVMDKSAPGADLPYANTEILMKNSAAGGWIASAQDLARFMYALSGGKIVSPNLVSIMTARPSCLAANTLRYFGMGLRMYRIDNQDYWVMTGSFTGTNSYAVRKPDGTVIVVLFNSRPTAGQLFSRLRPQLSRLLISST